MLVLASKVKEGLDLLSALSLADGVIGSPIKISVSAGGTTASATGTIYVKFKDLPRIVISSEGTLKTLKALVSKGILVDVDYEGEDTELSIYAVKDKDSKKEIDKILKQEEPNLEQVKELCRLMTTIKLSNVMVFSVEEIEEQQIPQIQVAARIDSLAFDVANNDIKIVEQDNGLIAITQDASKSYELSFPVEVLNTEEASKLKDSILTLAAIKLMNGLKASEYYLAPADKDSLYILATTGVADVILKVEKQAVIQGEVNVEEFVF